VNREAFLELAARRARGSVRNARSIHVGTREIAHFHADGNLDVRLTKAAIRERRIALRSDNRVVLRRSASDWLEVRIETAADEAFALDLVADAAAAERALP
jgi:hypothetical protein